MFFKKTSLELYAITSGELLDLSEVDDPVFSKKMVGDGYAINSNSQEITAPCSGEVTVVFPTKHAYGMKTKYGHEILIHLGIDTVNLQGNGFISHVQVGDSVKTGQPLATMDLDYIHSQGKSTTSMVVITSGEPIIEVLQDKKQVTVSDIIVRL